MAPMPDAPTFTPWAKGGSNTSAICLELPAPPRTLLLARVIVAFDLLLKPMNVVTYIAVTAPYEA